MVVGMTVAARTGRIRLLLTAWFAGTAAALGERHDLLGVVAQGFGDLAVQRRVVVVEVPEEGLETRSGHARTLPGCTGPPPSPAGKWRRARHGADRSQWREPDKCLNSGGKEEVLPASPKSNLRHVSVWRRGRPVYYRK